MKVITYIDVYPWTTGKGDIYFTPENNIQKKIGDKCKRYRVVIDVPDFHEIDGTIKANSEEVQPPADGLKEAHVEVNRMFKTEEKINE